MAPALLTAHDASGHIHLIIGSNPLASARCNRSLEIGAKPIVIAAPQAQIHYALQKKIDEGAVKWIDRSFQEADLRELGRPEVDSVVDAVFVTLGGKSPLSQTSSLLTKHTAYDPRQVLRYPRFAAGCGYLLM